MVLDLRTGTSLPISSRTCGARPLWATGGTSTPRQYADPETGLHHNNHRYYDPVTGAHLTPDPLGLAPAPKPHAYVPNPWTGISWARSASRARAVT
jgi:RHS repeat-associated protein